MKRLFDPNPTDNCFATIRSRDLIFVNALVLSILLLTAECKSAFGDQNTDPPYRPVSIAEIQQLFDLTIIRPDKCHFVADVALINAPATTSAISNELRIQKDALVLTDKQLTDEQRLYLDIARSNAIARALSGTRVIHVEEWYSGRYNRTDETDEGIASAEYLKAHPNDYYETFVNIHDPEFFPYACFRMHHELRDVAASKNPGEYFRIPYSLWRAAGVDQELAIPLNIQLIDVKSISSNRPPTLNKQDSDLLLREHRTDSTKVRKLRDGLIRNWSLEAKDDKIADASVIQYKLKGQYYAPEAPLPISPFEATYWIGNVAGRPVCVRAEMTNLNLHSSIVSTRDQFDKNGLPHVWNTSRIKNGSETQFNVTFKLIDIRPEFKDADVFALEFPSNYVVSDLTSGRPVLVRQPNPKATIDYSHGPVSQSSRFERWWSLRGILLVLLFLPPGLIIFLAYRKPRPR